MIWCVWRCGIICVLLFVAITASHRGARAGGGGDGAATGEGAGGGHGLAEAEGRWDLASS